MFTIDTLICAHLRETTSFQSEKSRICRSTRKSWFLHFKNAGRVDSSRVGIDKSLESLLLIYETTATC